MQQVIHLCKGFTDLLYGGYGFGVSLLELSHIISHMQL